MDLVQENIKPVEEVVTYWGKKGVFYSALLNARKGFLPLIKDSTNPHFKSKYATLFSVLDTASQALLDNGIVCNQTVTIANSCMIIVTELTAVMGIKDEEIGGVVYKSSFPIPSNMKSQEMGSWITYLRRYVLMPIFGIAPEDDDGNASSASSKSQQPQKAISKAQFDEISKLIDEAGIDVVKVCTAYKVQAIKDIPAAYFNNVIERLKKQVNAKTNATTNDYVEEAQ